MADDTFRHAQAVAIGSILRDAKVAAHVFARISTEDFDSPHREMAEAIHSLRVAQKLVEPLSVVDEMTKRGTIGRIGGPSEVIALAGVAGSGDTDYAVDVLQRRSHLRRLWAASTTAATNSGADDADPLAVARYLTEKAQAVIDRIEAEGDVTTATLAEFLDTEDAPFDWVIPGLLERGDRFILTGSEGLGKSVLQRQIAVCAAAGIHPFKHTPVAPVRVLLVDCENGPVKLRRALRPLVHQAQSMGADPVNRMFLEAIPAGLDLTKPEDEMWLTRTVAAIQPDILLTGPIYRLHAANPNDEEPARKVTQVLDRCRAAANCAVITEAHAGHAYGPGERPVRPTGTSLWLRWPEFGYGLRASNDYDPAMRVVDLVPWRGDREVREWPKRIKAGGVWPWSEDTSFKFNVA